MTLNSLNTVISTNYAIEKKKKSKKKVNITLFYKDVTFKSNKNPPENKSKSIIEYKDYENLVLYNYRLPELKLIAKHYKQKVSGKKKEILHNLYNFLKLSHIIIKIQKNIRKLFVKRYILLKGPAFFKRELCNNQSDFYTLTDMKDIEYNQFISIKDKDGFIYGFDMVSLYTYIKKNKKNPTNPYNRSEFTMKNNPINTIIRLIKISKILNIPTNIKIENEVVSYSKQLELRALSVFQEIDALGNYTDSSWLLSLNMHQLITFIHELYDIWTYRAQIDHATKVSICPPLGNPFLNINMQYISQNLTLNELKSTALSIIEKFIRRGINDEFKSLGACYVLTALTIVSSNAAISLPWFYQSVVY
jgi:hypothetical protein